MGLIVLGVVALVATVVRAGTAGNDGYAGVPSEARAPVASAEPEPSAD